MHTYCKSIFYTDILPYRKMSKHKEDMMMNKNLKRLGLLTLTGMLTLSQAPAVFAASKQAGSGKSELSSYNAELATQRTKLSELISESKSLTSQITAAQKNVKAAGYITKSSSEAISKLSGEIKAKRQELTGERGNNKTLRAAAKEARMSGDISSAKDQLILLEAVQEKQIKIRTELVELLESKLSYLNGMSKTSTTADDSVADTTAQTTVVEETAAETVIADNSNTTENAATETVAEGTAAETAAVETAAAENTASESITETSAATDNTAETAAEQKAEEIITDQAAIDAVFDDGAELEGEDF